MQLRVVARLSTLYKSDGYAANADVTRMVGLRSLQTGGEFAKGETLLQAKCRGSAISSRYQCELAYGARCNSCFALLHSLSSRALRRYTRAHR